MDTRQRRFPSTPSPLLGKIQPALKIAAEKLKGGYLPLLLTLVALAIRLPHWRTIPPAGDEVNQAIYALQIAQGRRFPLVGNDAYAGPFFFYLLALLFRLGVTDPLVGRTVILVAGTLTTTLTYAWVRALHGSRLAGAVAAGIVAINPHLVLLNSHVGGTTFLLPFLTTSFLWLLSTAVDSDGHGWLMGASILGGLAVQSNPIAGLLVAGGWAWATFRVRHSAQLGRNWPLWPLVGGLCILLVYSPVIAYNVTSDLDSLHVLGQRSYLQEADPSIHTFLVNEWRLALQLVRQVSGVLMGDETAHTLLGLALIYLAWMLAGLAFTARKVSLLPTATLLPFLLILPYFSSHYGPIDPVRFTSPLTPVLAAAMGLVCSAGLKRITRPCVISLPYRREAKRLLLLILAACLAAYPLASLFQYYDFVEENHLSGRALLDLSRQMVDANRGQRVYVSDTDHMRTIQGVPYVPRAYLLFSNIYQEFLPPDQIIGRLFERPEPAFLLIGDEDAATIEQFAHLIPWPSAANEEARRLEYGLYTFDAQGPLVKPDFVLTGDDARFWRTCSPPDVPIGVLLGNGVELIGYGAPHDTKGGQAAPPELAAGETLHLTLYWRAVEPLPQGTYVGFVHLYHPVTAALVAQDDHVLGQERYPVNAWQPDEVIVERYSLHVPGDVEAGRYALRAGVYTWPDLTRLEACDDSDGLIELGAVIIEQ